jgi:N-acetylglutamate synthase-like GNAT family acetyltransferase
LRRPSRLNKAVPVIPTHTAISVTLASPDGEDASKVLRAYWRDIVSRYQGRRATEAEIDSVMVDWPSDDLKLPHGLFWVATQDSAVVGCAGLRLLPAGLGEVTRVFVADNVRRRGLGSRLLKQLENVARTHGVLKLQLDTRHDLVEARRLYVKHGYREVPAFNDSPYAEHWFTKILS